MPSPLKSVIQLVVPGAGMAPYVDQKVVVGRVACLTALVFPIKVVNLVQPLAVCIRGMFPHALVKIAARKWPGVLV